MLQFQNFLGQPTGDVKYTNTHQRVSWNDTKQSNGEVPAVPELWGMRSTASLPLLPGSLWPGVVAPDRALSMG